MATKTKKTLEEDYTNQPQAQTAEDVEGQDTRTRLWQSLNTAYDQQRKQSDESYDQAISQLDRSMIGRGMQRSSYLGQTMANMEDKKAEANRNITSNQIADYQNRLTQLEQQEKEDERWERQFAETQRQFNEGQEFQRTENALNRAFQTSEREAQQAYQRGENELNRAFTTSEREAQQAWQTGENAANREFTTAERLAQQEWQTGENLVNREWQATENQMNRQLQIDQFREQMDYNKKTTEQQIAINYIMNMLETNDKPSDALLEQAGISRKDYEQMKKKANKSSGGGGGGSKNPTTGDPNDTNGNGVPDWYESLMNSGNTTPTATTPTDDNKKKKKNGGGGLGMVAHEDLY